MHTKFNIILICILVLGLFKGILHLINAHAAWQKAKTNWECLHAEDDYHESGVGFIIALIAFIVLVIGNCYG